MVKNFSGGNKSKGFARKNFIIRDSNLRISEDTAEVYAQVTKIYGGSACQVHGLNGSEYFCHIRGKFRGRGKRDNFISVSSWLLVGLREWENPAPGKVLNCDVIEVYNDSDKIKLKNTITNINWTPFINNDTRNIGAVKEEDADGDIIFSDEKTIEYENLIESQVSESIIGKQISITSEDGEEINVDDI
jgi:hypothetical protein